MFYKLFVPFPNELFHQTDTAPATNTGIKLYPIQAIPAVIGWNSEHEGPILIQTVYT